MKKFIIIIFSLIFCMPFLSHAGYKKFQWLTDGSCYAYTLFDANSYIIAATEQGDYSVGGVKNRIVLIKTDLSFNITNSVSFKDTIRGVRDIKIHSICPGGNGFIMCGSIDDRAIIATVNQNFNNLTLYEYPAATVFYSICGMGVCGKDNNSGLMFFLDVQNLGTLDGYQTPTPWEFHKVTYVGTVSDMAFSGATQNRNTTGFAFFSIFSGYMTPKCFYEFSNSINPDSYCSLFADCIDTTRICVLSTSYGNQIKTFFIDSATGNMVLRATSAFSHPDGYDLYLQDTRYSNQPNNNRFAWTGYFLDNSTGLLNGFHISMDFNYANLPNSPFYNVPFYNYYTSSNTDYKLYQVLHDNNTFSSVGYYNENNSTGVFTAFPEITSYCDNTTKSLGEDYTYEEKSFSSVNLNPYSIMTDTIYSLYAEVRTFNTDTCKIIPDENPTNFQKTATNIKTFENKEAKIFVSGNELHVENVAEATDYRIFSADGKLIAKGTISASPISVSSYISGFYTLVLMGEKTITSYKFVITRK